MAPQSDYGSKSILKALLSVWSPGDLITCHKLFPLCIFQMTKKACNIGIHGSRIHVLKKIT